MREFRRPLFVGMAGVVLLSLWALLAAAPAEEAPKSPYAKWINGPSIDPAYFPIGVSTQAPELAAEYKKIGVNLYLRLWDGPTEEQLEHLRKAGMQTICNQNAVGLATRDKGLIIGWTLHDEPDIAQSMKRYWKNDREKIRRAWPELTEAQVNSFTNYGPPMPWQEIVETAEKFAKADPTRPVRLNLGMGVAHKDWHGRGTRTGKLEDYPKYIKGSDIISFDIYPCNESKPPVKDKLWYQAVGLKRLAQWTKGRNPIWNYIETTQIFNQGRKPTKEEIRSQIWISIIHGSKGIVYFCHGVHPKDGSFWDRALFNDKQQMSNLGEINREILAMAPVINSPVADGAVSVRSSAAASKELAEHDLDPIAVSARHHNGSLYILSVRMEDAPATAEFTLTDPRVTAVEVIGEDRKIKVENGKFADQFKGYQVHLYKAVD